MHDRLSHRTRTASAGSARGNGVWRRAPYLGFFVGVLLLVQPATAALGVPPTVGLGTAKAFSVLAGSTVTNTGPTVISADKKVGGNLGVSPGAAVTGFPPPEPSTRPMQWPHRLNPT
jgi:hypothetical protein